MNSQEHGRFNPQSISSAIEKTEARFQAIITATGLESNINQLSPASLAYIGDAVYELYIRTFYLCPPKRISAYHNQVVAQVRAESQAKHLQLLLPLLSEKEIEILRRGRNAATKCPRRLSPEIYQQATSLETLFGYLYLSDPRRLTQLLAQLALS